jgi:hypothetical protein
MTMQSITRIAAAAILLALCACAAHSSKALEIDTAAAPAAAGTLAQIYYWKAKPGKFDEYSRYIRELAEPIDHEAQRRGAFLSVTTYTVRDTLNPWTHMRVFILRDSAQLQRLSVELDSAGIRLHPDSAKRRARNDYSASLRDRIGAVTTELLR